MPDLLVTDCGSMGKGAASPQSVTVRVVLLLSKDVFSAAASSLDHTVWYLTMILRICELSSLERMLPPFISHAITESLWDGVRESPGWGLTVLLRVFDYLLSYCLILAYHDLEPLIDEFQWSSMSLFLLKFLA